ncbi:MAG: cytochrome c3 family protein [candidate division KSB1 bacterium]|nr:cytochrome c3 family protein [candidate division KSB1 bacterium]
MKNLYYIIILFVFIFCSALTHAEDIQVREKQIIKDSVCPPFFLKDEAGNVIDPVNNLNADKPYSPKQTCGAAGCHDYEKITKGYHFTQGAGEKPTAAQAERIQWASTPGNYGGNWCSPAPLYRYLSPKENDNPKTMDMTSFSFITAGCGNCHPGGGSAEYDRNGKRYDKFMTEKGYTAGGDNDFDGDYYQAHWNNSGAMEGDCMICHQPEYNFSERKKQLSNFNFRWMPTAAAGWATVTGSIQKNESVKVIYNTSLFDSDGRMSPHIVREPRNNACLECHAQPGWKKRGANFSVRTDVHLRAGLKCVDCHPAGSKALDKRINEREMHQIAKGDDPGGLVRNDLDNTMLDCDYCHSNGHLGAPVAKHSWLPPLHLDNIACQTCHIPQRTVKPALFQAGDVFNPGTKIPSKGKHLWTFYGPDMQYYNHYGNMGMMGYDDKPTDPFTPVLARYKGKIYPVNRVHSAWPAIEIDGKPGLMQPKMGDIYKMWTTYFKNPDTYPELSKIKDDNGNGVIEVNRPEEIDALIAAVTSILKDTKYPMDGKRVVWAMNDRVYTSGTEYRTISKEEWEASVYGNMHKYNHDVYPAKTALGVSGCTDCHSADSPFFASVVQYPFDENGKPVLMPQYKLLGLNGALLTLGAFRETYVKPVLYFLLILLCCVFIGWAYKRLVANRLDTLPSLLTQKWTPLVIPIAAFIGFLIMLAQPQLKQYALPTRFWLDANHFLISALIIIGAFAFAAQQNRKQFQWLFTFIVIAIIAGVFMLLKLPLIGFLTRLSYSVFEVSIVLLVTIIFIFSIMNLSKSQFD